MGVESSETSCGRVLSTLYEMNFFPIGATAPIWALAYLHETLRFTSVY
jgi:hypothetical protein